MSSEFVPFASDSLMWRINRERIVLLGGPAAAVLQVAHPQVGRGVAAHSQFRSDTMGRLHRTLDAVYTVAFGTAEEVESVRRAVAGAHKAVRGVGYSAFDPAAQWWVLATLIMGSANVYRRFVGELTAVELDQFLAENARFGEVFGLSAEVVPTRWSEFEAYWQDMMSGPLLGSDPVSAEVAKAVIRPDAPWTLRQLSPVFQALTLEYLSLPVAKRLCLAPGRAQHAIWALLDLLLPGALRLCPPRLRYASQYLAAVRRTGRN